MWTFKGYATPDGETVCELCIVDAHECAEIAHDDFDTPQHCSYCMRPLRHDLTSDGVAYVLLVVREDMKRGRARRLELLGSAAHRFPPGHYYHGTSRYEFTSEWIERIQGARLDRADRRLIELFHAWSKPASH